MGEVVTSIFDRNVCNTSRLYCTYTEAEQSSINKTDRHDIIEILLKVALNTHHNPNTAEVEHN
jgi:hypothetical protein